jgi:hypothetical protein
MRHFRVFLYPEEAGLAPSWPAGFARDRNDERTAPTKAIGSILAGAREGKMEIPDKQIPILLRELEALAPSRSEVAKRRKAS